MKPLNKAGDTDDHDLASWLTRSSFGLCRGSCQFSTWINRLDMLTGGDTVGHTEAQTQDISAMTMQAYNQVSDQIPLTAGRVGPQIVVSFGAYGEQFAATKRARGWTIHCRVWLKSSQRWTKWRKLQVGEVLRLATAADTARFAPDYGPAWERE